jgi:hypothetical protein
MDLCNHGLLIEKYDGMCKGVVSPLNRIHAWSKFMTSLSSSGANIGEDITVDMQGVILFELESGWMCVRS